MTSRKNFAYFFNYEVHLLQYFSLFHNERRRKRKKTERKEAKEEETEK
jgi:hypothetical protein